MPKIDIVNAKNIIESNPEKAFFKLKNTGGPKGDTGAQGPQGPKGDTGAQGPAGASASVTVGSTTTLSPGADATVTNSGDTRNAILNFGIPTGARGPKGDTGDKGDTGPMGPKGAKGDTGSAATVQVGNTNTGDPGTNAQVTNAGNEHFAVLNFTIPRGDKGETGATGAQGQKGDKGDKGDTGAAATVTVGTTTTSNPGTNATVTNSGTTSAAVLNFGIPRGATGSVKSEVVSELPETGEGDTFYLVNREATTQTATGKAINFTNSDNSGDITDFKLDGETSQNGTPTPSAPVAVNTTTGENVVKICGKNLFETPASATNNGITFTLNSDGTYNISGTATAQANDIVFVDSNIFVNGATYTLSANHPLPNGIRILVEVYNGSTWLRHALGNNAFLDATRQSITAAMNTTGSNRIRLTLHVDNGTTVNISGLGIQLEKGSTATSYEPYQGQSYTLSLGSIELCKIGDYQDYIYKSDGKWKIHKAVGKQIVDTSTIVLISNYSNIEYAQFAKPTNYPGYGNYNSYEMVCSNASYLGIATEGWDYSGYAGKISPTAVEDKTWIGFTKGTGLDAIKAALTGCVVYYPLATPTDTEITNEALIAQLDNVASAPLYAGVNNITTITPNEQGTLEIKYVTYDKYNQNKVYIWNDTLQQWQIIVQ